MGAAARARRPPREGGREHRPPEALGGDPDPASVTRGTIASPGAVAAAVAAATQALVSPKGESPANLATLDTSPIIPAGPYGGSSVGGGGEGGESPYDFLIAGGSAPRPTNPLDDLAAAASAFKRGGVDESFGSSAPRSPRPSGYRVVPPRMATTTIRRTRCPAAPPCSGSALSSRRPRRGAPPPFRCPRRTPTRTTPTRKRVSRRTTSRPQKNPRGCSRDFFGDLRRRVRLGWTFRPALSRTRGCRAFAPNPATRAAGCPAGRPRRT